MQQYIDDALKELLAPHRGGTAYIALSRVRKHAGLPLTSTPFLLRHLPVGYTVTVNGRTWKLVRIDKKYADKSRGTERYKKVYLLFVRIV